MKLLNGLGIALVLFYVWVFIAVNFVTVGVDSTDTKESTQQTNINIENTKLRANLEDATILGKFWNSKGHFIVVYNGTTKAPEVLKVELNEWELMHVGELYQKSIEYYYLYFENSS